MCNAICYTWRITTTILLTLSSFNVLAATNNNNEVSVKFDDNILHSFGIDKKTINQIISQSTKPLGVNTVGLSINGKYAETLDIDFGQTGNACITQDILVRYNIKPALLLINESSGCVEEKSVSQFETVFKRNNNALHLNIADYLFDKNAGYKKVYSGGTGAFLNYDIYGNKTDSASSNHQNISSLMSFGINTHNVMMRTNFSWNKNISKYQGEHSSHSSISLSSSYLEADVIGRYHLRTGYIGVGNTMFGAGQVLGLTMDNHTGLAEGDTTVTVSGVASGFAQVEVFQQNRLIFSRPTAAGNFSFVDVPLHTAFSDAEVVIKVAEGVSQRFTIPKAAFSVSESMSSRYSFFAGQQANTVAGDWVIGMEYRFPFYYYAQPISGLLVTPHYLATGLGLGFNWIPYNSRGEVSYTLAKQDQNGNLGAKVNVMLSTQLVNLNPYFSLDWQNRHYRDLGSSQYDRLYFSQNDRYPDHYNMHYTASMGGSFNATERLCLGLALSRNTTYDAGSSNGLSLFSSWSGDGYALSQSISYNWCNNDRLSREWSWFTNLNIPFNLGGRKGSSSSYLNNVQGQTRIGTSFSQTFTDNLQLSAGIERSAINSNNEARHFIRASWLTPYNNTSWHYSGNSRNNRNYSANLSGSLVAAKSRLVFSSERVRDTFAIADTAMKGYVTLLAPTGRTITNYDGLAVIPQLHIGNSNVITIDTKSMPDGAWVKNSRKDISVTRGAVADVNFDTGQSERLHLLQLKNDKHNFPLGTTVVNDHAEVLGRTIDKNILMIDEDNINKLSMGHAIVESNENNRCYFNGETVDSSVKSDLIEINVYCDEKE